ncbi:hypothetical protein PROFUN_14754 [Planoprotostelium fungivorum]|uniref:Uncharacterized protein n=1 Tax=Planoprotostelium fungivorum TaxID=1890364 RepID=A0A2P6MY48_9EUKA|nr:hypothetical protein PROFUN_14754 [Planoprotostelium fungivorum]
MPTKLYYKQKYDQYKQLLDSKLSQNVLEGMYYDVIQDYHEGYTGGELCTKYKLTYLNIWLDPSTTSNSLEGLFRSASRYNVYALEFSMDDISVCPKHLLYRLGGNHCTPQSGSANIIVCSAFCFVSAQSMLCGHLFFPFIRNSPADENLWKTSTASSFNVLSLTLGLGFASSLLHQLPEILLKLSSKMPYTTTHPNQAVRILNDATVKYTSKRVEIFNLLIPNAKTFWTPSKLSRGDNTPFKEDLIQYWAVETSKKKIQCQVTETS